MPRDKLCLINLYPIAKRSSALVRELIGIWEASVRLTHHFLAEEDVASLRPEVQGALMTVPALAVVADAAGRNWGFLALNGEKVEALFLAPEARGQGLGRQLMEWAVDQGARSVDVNVGNDQALDFYLHLGFKLASAAFTVSPERDFPLYRLELDSLKPKNEPNDGEA
ncbi:MAG: GNAT family N-acetyltransferase [Deltaproteobacteria bacterium]|jgi:putative acetyltransferase|nr:GNAT family N-acetyltransferase [Deltaproteobacteria bacterium]